MTNKQVIISGAVKSLLISFFLPFVRSESNLHPTSHEYVFNQKVYQLLLGELRREVSGPGVSKLWDSAKLYDSCRDYLTVSSDFITTEQYGRRSAAF
jgi:hypothetical protein